jgi:hypothetical protein
MSCTTTQPLTKPERQMNGPFRVASEAVRYGPFILVRNLFAVSAFWKLKRKLEMFANKKTAMPDTITMINVVWTAVIAVMMTATVTLYQDKSDQQNFNYTQISGQFNEQPYY